MGYDFTIQVATIPEAHKLPISLDELLTKFPEALSPTIQTPDDFWQLLANYPGMIPNGLTLPAQNFLYEGKRFPGSGFQVYAVHKLPSGFNPLAKLSSRASPDECLRTYAESEASARTYPLQGISLDISGSRYDVLDLYLYLRNSIGNLVIIDKQTAVIHDGESFRQFLLASGSR